MPVKVILLDNYVQLDYLDLESLFRTLYLKIMTTISPGSWIYFNITTVSN